MFTYLDARHRGGDRPEGTANLRGGVGFEVPHVQVRRTAEQVDEDARSSASRPSRQLLPRRRPQARQGRAGAGGEQPADAQKGAAVQSRFVGIVTEQVGGGRGVMAISLRLAMAGERCGDEEHCVRGVPP